MQNVNLNQEVNRNTFGRVVFRIIGACALLLAAFWNPIVLRPRFWNATVIAHGIAIEAILIAVGFGLIGIRKWAAVGLSLVAALSVAKYGFDLFGICLFLIPSILTIVFWPALVRGKRRDCPYVLAAVLISVLTEYIAFALRHH